MNETDALWLKEIKYLVFRIWFVRIKFGLWEPEIMFPSHQIDTSVFFSFTFSEINFLFYDNVKSADADLRACNRYLELVKYRFVGVANYA